MKELYTQSKEIFDSWKATKFFPNENIKESFDTRYYLIDTIKVKKLTEENKKWFGIDTDKDVYNFDCYMFPNFLPIKNRIYQEGGKFDGLIANGNSGTSMNLFCKKDELIDELKKMNLICIEQ
jgi:hypothetical protein